MLILTETLTNKDFSNYLQILQRLLPHMQSSVNNDDLDSSDSEEDMDISDPVSSQFLYLQTPVTTAVDDILILVLLNKLRSHAHF